MSDREPTLKPKQKTEVVSPGVRGTPVDLMQMADDELKRTGQEGFSPSLGPNFVHSEQHLSDKEMPPITDDQDEESAPVRGLDRPYPPKKDVKALISQIKEKLGVQRVKPLDVKVGDLRFTMVKLSDSDSQWALSNMTENTQHRSESLSSIRTSIAAISVRAIEGIPLYEVMEINLPEDSRGVRRVVEDPIFPPLDIRFAAATRFLNQLQTDLDDTIGPDLYAIYNAEIEEKNSVSVEVDSPFSEKPSEKEETQS